MRLATFFGDEWSLWRALSALWTYPPKYPGKGQSPPLSGNAMILGAYGPPTHPLWTDPSIHLLDDRLDTFISWNIWESMVIGAKLCYRSPKTTGCQASLPDWSRVAALTVVVPPFWRIPWDSWMWPHKCKSGLEEENGRVLIIWWWKLYCILLGPRGPLGVQPSVRPSVFRTHQKYFNQWKFTINHYIIMSDLSSHIFSESSWPQQSTDDPRWQRNTQIHKYTNQKCLKGPSCALFFQSIGVKDVK